MTNRPPPLAPRNPKLPDMIERNPWESPPETLERQEVVEPPEPPKMRKAELLSKWRWPA